MSTAEELEKLAKLKDKGIITEDEFNAKRNEMLSADDQIVTENNQKGDSYLSIIVLILSIIAAGLIYKGGHDLGNISNRSSFGAYYYHLGFVYRGLALFVLTTGIFFSVLLKRSNK